MSNYWKKRIEEEMKAKQEADTSIGIELKRLHNHHFRNIELELDSFIQKYADKNVIEPREARKRVSVMDVVAFSEKAKRYVEEKNFSPQANAELAIYNMKMKMNRLELLQYNIDLELVALADTEHKMTEKFLNAEFVQEMNFQAGILSEFVPNPKMIGHMAQAIINTPYQGANWSQRIWSRQNELRSYVANMAAETLLRGRNATKLVPEIRRLFDVSASHAKRLAVTETARIQTAVQKASYEENGFDQYEFMPEPTACEICAVHRGKIYKVTDMEPGKNAAPMHPHCHCSTAPYVDRGKLGNRFTKIEEKKEETHEVDIDDLFMDENDVNKYFKEQEKIDKAYREEYNYVRDKDWQLLFQSAGNITEEEMVFAYANESRTTGYIATPNSFKINKSLYSHNPSLINKFDEKTIEIMDKVMERNKAPFNFKVDRYMDSDVFGVIINQNKHLINLNYDLDKIIETINVEGANFVNAGFTSTSRVPKDNFFKNRDIKLVIDIPKDSNVFVTENHEESEIILPRNTKFEIYGLEIKNNQYVFNMKVTGDYHDERKRF